MPRRHNTHLQQVVASSGLKLESIARAVREVALESDERLRTNKSTISLWASGQRTPSGRAPAYLAEALSRLTGRLVTTAGIGYDCADGDGGPELSDDPVAAVINLGEASMERRRILTAALFGTSALALPLAYDHEAAARTLRARQRGARVGQLEIVTVRQTTAAFSRADERLGGGHGLAAVTAYLSEAAAPMLKGTFASEADRRDAFGAVAELAYLAGWKHHDLGQEGAAQRFYLAAFQLACEADPYGHAAWMLRALVHHTLNLGRPEFSVELGDSALRRARGRDGGQFQALILATSARAHAAAGNKRQAASAMLKAEQALTADADPLPVYAVTGPAAATVANHKAKTLQLLGDHAGAELAQRSALAGRDPQAFRRVAALTAAELGKSLSNQHRADEAVITWGDAMDLMNGVTSRRHLQVVRGVRSVLTGYIHRGVPGSAELDQRARDVLAS